MAIALSPNTTTEGASTNDMTGQFWQTIWSLGIPNMLKTFAWKASCNILPTKVNLCRRGVIDNATCEACGMAEETSGHLFWDCTKAREVWVAIGISFDATDVSFKEFVDLLWYVIFVQCMDLHTFDIGVIIRDHEGSVIAALSKHLPLPLGPLEAEAKAADEAVSFAWDVGVREVIFETKSKVVSDALCGTITPQVSFVDVIGGTLH
uniref:Reverse transcriptase zinc-binding domain-containing protein n=1 Tax=Quercus lobata TaxID=97700 RepID=A0A7N2MHX6_QUELO